MTKAISTPIPSRRALLGGSAALLAGAAITTMPAAGTAATSPDAELIRLCGEHPKNKAAFNASELDADETPLWGAYERTRDGITGAKPQTLAALAAKARAAVDEATDPDGVVRPEGTMGATWAWDLVNDLIRIADVPA